MGYTWSLMTEFQQDIINNFHNLVKKHQLVCDHKSFIDAHYAYDVYSVPYSSIMNLFISELTGLNKSLISQYVAAQQFFFLLSDNPIIDITVCLRISKNVIYIDFKKIIDGNFEVDNQEFLQVEIMADDTIKMIDYRFHSLLECSLFESSYNTLLQDIKSIVDPDIDSFKQVLALSNKNTLDVLNKKLETHQIKAISSSEFFSVYLNDQIFEYVDEVYIELTEEIFMSFLKDNFSNKFYSKFRNIISVSLFQEKFCKRTTNWNILTAFSISFPQISKYAEFNCIYRIAFSVMPYDDYRCTIDVIDDGTISFCYIKDDVSVELTNFNDIYEYVKEGLISSIEKTLDIERKDIRTSHFKLYEMMLL